MRAFKHLCRRFKYAPKIRGLPGIKLFSKNVRMYNVSEATFSLNIVVKFYFLFMWKMTSSKSFIIKKIQKGFAVYNKKNGKASYIARSFPSSVKQTNKKRACRLESVLINLSDGNLMGPWLMRCVRLRLWFSGCSSAVRAERCIYFSPTIHRIMRQYVPWSNMAHSGCFLFIFLVSWGTTLFSIRCVFLIPFLFCTNTICATCRNNCGHCGASTSCEEVPNCNTSETGGSVSHQRCCRCSSGEVQTTFNKNIKIVWKVDWSRIVSLCVSEQTFPDVLQYFLTITEQNYTLHLEKNTWEFTTHLASHCKKVPVL